MASFLMSFAATLGLVALVQLGMPRLFAASDSSTAARVALWGGREVVTLVLASMVAGFATTPYSAFHFHRVTPYGVLANLAAMPVVSALVMPAGLLGLLAMPFGFDGVFWQLMGWGINWMIVVTEWVARLPGAVGRVTAFGTGPLIVASLGIVVLGLLRTPLRWAGAVMLLVSIGWAFAVPQPDILVSGDGRNIAVRAGDGRLHLLRAGSKDAFLVKEWLAADADPRVASDPSLNEGASCDEAGCVVQMADGGLVAQALRSEALADDCLRASLVVSARQPPKSCAAPVIDRERLQRQGALALRRTTHGFAIDAARAGADRPWAPGAAGAADADIVVGSRPSASPAPDATPAETDFRPTNDAQRRQFATIGRAAHWAAARMCPDDIRRAHRARSRPRPA
jgi:competence protein ComEC